MTSACLTENDVQAFLAGALRNANLDAIENHLDACLKCQLLLSAGLRTASLRTHGVAADAPAQPHLKIGQLLSDRYEITRFIARGGMGEVYAAHDRMLGDEIALKVLFARSSARSDAFARLRAEVQLSRQVTDPHVLRVFDLGSFRSPDGTELPFLTMQLLRGETLRARVLRCGPFAPVEVWRLAGDLFAALGAAHRIGIIHRDFKSENVMLVATAGGPDRAIVMDFGLAQVIASNIPPVEGGAPLIAGTLGYMAPEMLTGGVVTAAADVYAFGVVLFEMLTGLLPPFRLNDPPEGRGPPPSPLLDTLDVPVRWRMLIRRCLARDPEARFRNIIEAHDAVAAPAGRKQRVLFATAMALAATTTVGAVVWKRASPPAIRPATVTVSATSPAPLTARETPIESGPSTAVLQLPGRASPETQRKTVRPRTRRAQDAPERRPDTPIIPHESVIQTDELIDPFAPSR
jgi:serine/threonine protein kinase